MKTFLVKYTLYSIIYPLLLLSLTCCGGGTRGTGDLGGTFVVTGTIQDENGDTINDAEIIFLWSGESTKTDENGFFEVETSADDGQDLSIEISRADTKLQTSLGNYKSDQTALNVILEVQTSSDALVVLDISVETVESPSDSEDKNEEINIPNDEIDQNESAEEPNVRSIQVQGSLSYINDTPVIGAEIRVVGSSNEAKMTNNSGGFRIKVHTNKTNIKIRILKDGYNETLTLRSLREKKDIIVSVKLRIAVLDPNVPVTAESFDLSGEILVDNIEVIKKKKKR